MTSPFKTAILIPVYNHLEYTRKCLKSLDDEIFSNDIAACYDVVVIDDGSTDGTEDYVRSSHPGVHILKGDGNLWWSGSINAGADFAIKELKADYLLLWNNDIITAGNYFRQLIDWQLSTDNNTITGSKIYMDESMRLVWSMGGRYDPVTGSTFMYGLGKPDAEEFMKTIEVEWLTGMGTLVPVNVVNKIGMWDNLNFPQYHGDLEFTYRAYLEGYKVIVNPDLKIINDTTNTGLAHNGSLRQLLRLFNDPRSLYNFRVNVSFIKKYGKGIFRYNHLIKSYLILILSFLKSLLFRKRKDK